MSKKRAKELLDKYLGGAGPMEPTWVYLMDAIIDALPEEPTPFRTEFCPLHKVAYDLGACCPMCLEEPEPKEVKESQPTSTPYRNPTNEELDDHLSVHIQLVEARAEIARLRSDLGPQQPPNVASGATQSPDHWDALIHRTSLSEDARKLRIMKAMEACVKDGEQAYFALDKDGNFYQRTAIGLIRIND